VSAIGEQPATATVKNTAANSDDRRPRLTANAIMDSQKLFLKQVGFTSFDAPRIHGNTSVSNQSGAMHLFRRTRGHDSSAALYDIIVAQARKPDFYVQLGVPDTVDGRFDMIALHAFIVLRRIKDHDRDTAQALLEVIFDDMDRSLREMGAGDLGVSRRVKTMAKALYGRINAYEESLDTGEAALADALRRNLYGTVDPDQESVAAMAASVRAEVTSVDNQSPEDIAAGIVSFGPPPGDG
jgi:cytochrome b pre-mRNA-processing protein 3